MNVARLLWFFFSLSFCLISICAFLSSLYFSFLFVESCCFICIVYLCFVRGGVDSPSPEWGKNGKLRENWKGQVSSSEKSTVIYAGFSVESLECFYFIWKRAVQGAESCHLFVVLRGLEVPRGLGGRDVQFYLYMVEFCVSLQTPNLTSSIWGCRYGGRTELTETGV